VTTTARRRSVVSVLVVACVTCLQPAGAAAQTSLQVPLQFDFLNPGAKSMALGGAFAGLADDATATFANPAGLTQLAKSELSMEARFARVRTRFLQRGRLSGTILNEQNDTIQGAVFGTTIGTHFGPGYLSAVYVPKPKTPDAGDAGSPPSHLWVLAAYRHELVRVNQDFFSEGVFQQASGEFTSRRDTPQLGERTVDVTAYGVSGSYKPYASLAVGASLTLYDFHLDSTFRRFGTVGFLGPPDLTKEDGRSTQKGDDIGIAPTVGLLWTKDRARVGVVYRRGASLDFATQSGTTPETHSVFRVPNTLALGVAFRLRQTVMLATEITRVTYSRIREDFVTDQARASQREADFTLDDGVEIHAGAQYVKPAMRFRPRFRAGLWYDPDHSVHFSPAGNAVTALDRLFAERLATALSTGKSQVHFTGGIGLSFGSRVEFNAGLDIASTTRLFSTSLIVK
jgi:long-subunit fatty acid transport protein